MKNIYEKLNDICEMLLRICEISNKEQAILIQDKIVANLFLFDIIADNCIKLMVKLNSIKIMRIKLLIYLRRCVRSFNL